MRLLLDTLRVEAGSASLPAGRFTATGTGNTVCRGKTVLESLSVVTPGPIRATLLIRGHVAVPHLGKGLPEAVKKKEPPGRLPFSLRLSFFRHLPVVFGQTQFTYTGEPDADFIARWALELPGLSSGGEKGITVLEPGVELLTTESTAMPNPSPERRTYGTLKGGGFALIRHGWENRPAGITHASGSAFLDFWPQRAGLWDLRRYAREWGVGETGARREQQADMEQYARFAARGLAKSHDFVCHFGTGEAESASVRAHADHALLTASPAWIAATRVLGPSVVEQTRGPLADLDAALRRTLDYYLFNQDLYRWHGKLTYGFWQSRNGNIHRNDRWDREYGRWGWALGDGAGRIPHMLMAAWLRTGERRYLKAGEAGARALYDTSMVHTLQHLENATRTWWTVVGCNHRHNVQPFGCPYIGMRGSYPGGARILYFLTGDGVIKDGLDLVVDAAEQYLTNQPGRFGCSGGPDGQGAGANALLFAFESTGDRKYLDLVRTMLDRSGLFPPGKGKRPGYGPAFGLFNAAVEYADLTGDEAFRKRVVETARRGSSAKKNRHRFLTLFAAAHRYTGEQIFLEAIRNTLPAVRTRLAGSLAELPPGRWPGHGGARTADPRANLFRDLPCAMAALGVRRPPFNTWPKARPLPAMHPAAVPGTWPRPGGHPGSLDRVIPPATLLKKRSNLGTLRTKVTPFTTLVTLRGTDDRNGLTTRKSTASIRSVTRVTRIRIQGQNAFRVQSAVAHTGRKHRLLTWGLRLPLPLGRDRTRIRITAGGAFRTEQWRVDMNDEEIPDWLTSDVKPRWPVWRIAGLSLGPANSYRIWRANRADTSPLVTDEGFNAPGWIDVIDGGGRFGVTVRMLRPTDPLRTQAVHIDLEKGCLEIRFHDAGAPPLKGCAGGYSGACDILFHNGWRPPFACSLARPQFAKLLEDLDHGENHGLFAYRLRLARTHKARGPWAEKILESGVEPHQLLAGMMWRGALETFCRKIGVRFDAKDPDAAIRRIVAKYRRR